MNARKGCHPLPALIHCSDEVLIATNEVRVKS